MNNDKLIRLSSAVDLCRKKAKGYQPEMFGSDQECYTAKVVATELAGEIRNLPPVDAERAWISVKDRLPEQGQRVLFYAKGNETVYLGLYLYTGLKDAVWFTTSTSASKKNGGNYTASHWMPLPEPPEDV